MAVKEECTCPKVEERVEWIYTYGDMVTLLLCFFVLLFAMSSTEKAKSNAVAASFKGGPPASPFVFKGLPGIVQDVKSMMQKSDIAEVTDITIDDRGIAISFSDTVLFEPGQAEPTEKGAEVIEKFSKILHAINNTIIVEGHTDNVPSHGQFPSNWELSAARSASVVRLLEHFGIDPKRMEVAGYGETRPRVSNEVPSLRRVNRRIDVLVKPDGL